MEKIEFISYNNYLAKSALYHGFSSDLLEFRLWTDGYIVC